MFPYFTHPSATRYIAITVQLACFRPAASVRSEPGSNSHIYFFSQSSSCASSFSNYSLVSSFLDKNPIKTFLTIYIMFSHTYTLFRLHSSMHMTALRLILADYTLPVHLFSFVFLIHFFSSTTSPLLRFTSSLLRSSVPPSRWVSLYHFSLTLSITFLLFFRLFYFFLFLLMFWRDIFRS